MALQGYNAEVKVQSTPIAFTDEATSTSDDTKYTITDTGKNIWDYDSTVVVKDDGTITSEVYTISRLTGSITFDSVDATRVITITGEYTVPTTVATADEYTFTMTADTHDSTPFQASNRTYEIGNRSGTAELSRFFVTDGLFLGIVLDSSIKVIELYPASGGDPVRFFGIINSDTVVAGVNDLVKESVSYTITKEMEM